MSNELASGCNGERESKSPKEELFFFVKNKYKSKAPTQYKVLLSSKETPKIKSTKVKSSLLFSKETPKNQKHQSEVGASFLKRNTKKSKAPK